MGNSHERGLKAWGVALVLLAAAVFLGTRVWLAAIVAAVGVFLWFVGWARGKESEYHLAASQPADETPSPPSDEELAPFQTAYDIRVSIGRGKDALRSGGEEEQRAWREAVLQLIPEEDKGRFGALDSMPLAVGYVNHVANRLDRALTPLRAPILRRLVTAAGSLRLKTSPAIKNTLHRQAFDLAFWSQKVIVVLPEEWREGFESHSGAKRGPIDINASIQWLNEAIPRIEAEIQLAEEKRHA